MFRELVQRNPRLVPYLLVILLLVLPASTVSAQANLQLLQVLFDGAGVLGGNEIVVSPDGDHMYTTGGRGCLNAATRDSSTGTLAFLQVLCEIEAAVEGLNSARDIVASPNGEHLYVAAEGLTVLDRDPTSGLVELVSRLVEGEGGATGIARPEGIAISSDGAFLYAADYTGGAVSVFARDGSTGELSFVQALFDAQGGVSGIALARDLALSPDGTHLYVVDGEATGSVAVFTRDAGNGMLTFVQTIVDGQGGATGLAGPRAVAVSPDGDHVYVTALLDNAVTVFARNDATGMLTVVQTLVDGQGGLTLLTGPSGLGIRPDGSVVVVSTFPGNALLVFGRNDLTGMLTLVEESTALSLGTDLNNPGPPAFDPDGDHLYAASRFEQAIVALASAPATGALTFLQFYNDEDAQNDGLASVNGLAVSDDGRHVYTTATDGEGKIGLFDRDAASGQLTFAEALESAAVPVSLAETAAPSLSPDGNHLYVSELSTPDLIVFDRDPVSGELTFASSTAPHNGGLIRSMTFSADGRFLYAGDDTNDAVQVYSRDLASGALSFVQTLVDGLDAEGINDPDSLVLSPDGRFLYIGGDDDDAIARFSRDGVTGLLTFVDQVVDGVGGVDGLEGVEDLALSPGGEQLYAVSELDDAVTVFSRDSVTGALSFLQVLSDGLDGVEGLDSAQTISLTPDGTLVAVGSGIALSTGTGDQALAIFLRNAADGRLCFLGTADQVFDVNLDVPELNAVSDFTVTTDGNHLIAAYPSASALSVFALPTFFFADTFESGGTTCWSNVVQ